MVNVNQDSFKPKSAPSCPHHCDHCALDEGLNGWREAHDAAPTGELRHGRLVALAAGVFVAPLLAGVAVAMALGGGETRQFIGLAAGLTAALVFSALIGRRKRRPRTDKESA